MRRTLDQSQRAAGDQPVRTRATDLERDDGVRVPMQDQGRQPEGCEIRAKIGSTECSDAVERALRRCRRRHPDCIGALRLADAQGAAGAEELRRESFQEREPVGRHTSLGCSDGRVVAIALGIVLAAVHAGRHR